MKQILGLILIISLLHFNGVQAQEIPAQESKEITKKHYKTRYSPAAKEELVSTEFGMLALDSMQLIENDYARYLEIRFNDYGRTDRAVHQETAREMDQLHANIFHAKPNSYQYHFINYLNEGKRVGDASELIKAYELNPDATEMWPELMLHYELEQEKTKRNEIAKKIGATDIYPNEVYHYHRNVLRSMNPGAVLITYGDIDTYPMWFENVNHVNNKTEVINVSLTEDFKYRNSKLAELNLKSDIAYYTPFFFIKTLVEQNPDRDFYLGLTLPPEILKGFSDHLYLTGLVYKYEDQAIENLPLLASNWESFNMAYLIQKNIFTAEVNSLNKNYLPLLIALSDYYTARKKTKKKKEVEILIENISRRAGIENQVKQLRKG